MRYRALVISWLIVIIYLSLFRIESNSIPSTWRFEHLDKVAHLGMYSIFSFILMLSLKRRESKRADRLPSLIVDKGHITLLVLIVSISIGIIMELLQHYLTAYRSADIYDGVANTIGVILGIVAYNIVIKRFKKI